MPKVAFAWQLAAYIAINDWFVWLCSNVQIVHAKRNKEGMFCEVSFRLIFLKCQNLYSNYFCFGLL